MRSISPIWGKNLDSNYTTFKHLQELLESQKKKKGFKTDLFLPFLHLKCLTHKMRSSLAESLPCASQHYDLLVWEAGGVVRTAINKEPACYGVTELESLAAHDRKSSSETRF